MVACFRSCIEEGGSIRPGPLDLAHVPHIKNRRLARRAAVHVLLEHAGARVLDRQLVARERDHLAAALDVEVLRRAAL